MIYSLHDFKSLSSFGFDLLTGEACGLSTRLLFDCSPMAQGILVGFWGQTYSVHDAAIGRRLPQFREAWNSHKGDDGADHTEAWGSAMLDRNCFESLAAQCLAHVGCSQIISVCDDHNAQRTHDLYDRMELREMAQAGQRDGWLADSENWEVDCDHWLTLAAQKESRYCYYGALQPSIDGFRCDGVRFEANTWNEHIAWLKKSCKIGRIFRFSPGRVEHGAERNPQSARDEREAGVNDSLQDEEEESGDGEPVEDDYVTGDHEHFYQYGKLAVVAYEGEEWTHKLKAHMDQEQFWPNVWFISDHGNAHLIDMFDALADADERVGTAPTE